MGGEKIAIYAEVRVLYQENAENIIGQYIIFSKVYNEQRKLYGNTKQAVTETIRICKDRNVLKGYLESREQEVVSMMMTLFDDEQILKAYAKDIADSAAKEAAKKAAKEAEKRTAEKDARETAVRMIKDGELSLEKIAKYVPALSLEELKKLEAEVLQPT